MDELQEFFLNIFGSESFMPHGHCYLWRPEILWLHVFSDFFIGVSYYAIPCVLIYFIKKRANLLFNHIFWLFGSFILLCGTTHFIAIWTTWSAQYRLEGMVKLATAAVSVTTVFALIPVIPIALRLPRVDLALEEVKRKNAELKIINREMEKLFDSTIGREDRIIQLKQEINQLSVELGRNEPYKMQEIAKS